jgi:hypothetical protein
MDSNIIIIGGIAIALLIFSQSTPKLEVLTSVYDQLTKTTIALMAKKRDIAKELENGWDLMNPCNLPDMTYEILKKAHPRSYAKLNSWLDVLNNLVDQFNQLMDAWDQFNNAQHKQKQEFDLSIVDKLNDELENIRSDLGKLNVLHETLSIKSDLSIKQVEQDRLDKLKATSPQVYHIYNVLYKTQYVQNVDARRQQQSANFQQINNNIEQYRNIAETLMEIDEVEPAWNQMPTYDSRARLPPTSTTSRLGLPAPQINRSLPAPPRNFSQIPSQRYNSVPSGQEPAKKEPEPAFKAKGTYGSLNSEEIQYKLNEYMKKRRSPDQLRKRVLTRTENFGRMIQTMDSKLSLQAKKRLQSDYNKISTDFLLLEAAYFYHKRDISKDTQFSLIKGRLAEIDTAFTQKFGHNLNDMMKQFNLHKEKMNPEFDSQLGTKRNRPQVDRADGNKKAKTDKPAEKEL